MPLIKTYELINSQVNIWEIDKNQDDLESAKQISMNYHRHLSNYKNKNKINQILATRLLANTLFPGHELLQNKNGKPFLDPTSQQISLSNDKNTIALFASNEKCGIDIQSYNKSIKKIQHKFVNNKDFSYQGNEEELMWTWCAKESMYKIYGIPEIFFKDHLIIKQNNNNELYGECIHTKFPYKCALKTIRLKNYFLVYTKNLELN